MIIKENKQQRQSLNDPAFVCSLLGIVKLTFGQDDKPSSTINQSQRTRLILSFLERLLSQKEWAYIHYSPQTCLIDRHNEDPGSIGVDKSNLSWRIYIHSFMFALPIQQYDSLFLYSYLDGDF